MACVQRSAYIECPIDDVYDIALVDVEGLPDWMTSVSSVDKVDDDWPEVGSSHVYAGTIAGQSFVGRTTIVHADPPRSVDMSEETYLKEVGSKPLSQGSSRWVFEEQGNGTKATICLQGGKQNLVSWLIWQAYGRRRTERNLERTLTNLKRICEEELQQEEASQASDQPE